MKDRNRNMIVGLTAIAGLVGLAGLLMMFGYLPKWLEEGYVVRVELPAAGGLGKGSRVRLDGIDIGRVTTVDFQTAPKRGVVAKLLIDEGAVIPEKADFKVNQPLLTGSPSLAIDTTQLAPEDLTASLPIDGSAVVTGRLAGFLDEFNKAVGGPMNSIRQEMRGPMQRFERIEKSFTELSTHWQQVAANVNKLIEPRPLKDVDAGTLEANLSTLVQRTDQRVADMKEVLESMKAWNQSVKNVSTRIEATAEAATTTLNNANTTITEAQKDFDQVAKRYLAVADDLSALIRDTQGLVNKASNGEGTMGKLLNDPSLYENLSDSSERIGQALDQLKLLIEKWNKEGVPINF